jgi:hypothetical protein
MDAAGFPCLCLLGSYGRAGFVGHFSLKHFDMHMHTLQTDSKKKSLPRRSYLIYYCYLMKLENGELERYIIGGNDATS